MEKQIEKKEKHVEDSEEKIADSSTIKKRKCCNCKRFLYTDLQLENDEYICESCAQVMSDLSSF